MQCAIYKGRRKQDTYLYVTEKDDLSRVPETLLRLLGRLEHVMDLELTAERKLAQEDVTEVIRQLRERGWFLQLSPGDDEALRSH
jgi:uncharacterized protein YcgL (UPF0745 family)